MEQSEKPKLESATFIFNQKGNCVDSAEYESIIIDYKSDLGLDNSDAGFYVISTDQWSFDSVDELKELVNRIEKVLKK